MKLAEAKRRMTAKAAELAALVRARHLSYVGAEGSIARYAEQLSPGTDDYTDAWKLYDYGVEQLLAFHRTTPSQGVVQGEK